VAAKSCREEGWPEGQIIAARSGTLVNTGTPGPATEYKKKSAPQQTNENTLRDSTSAAVHVLASHSAAEDGDTDGRKDTQTNTHTHTLYTRQRCVRFHLGVVRPYRIKVGLLLGLHGYKNLLCMQHPADVLWKPPQVQRRPPRHGGSHSTLQAQGRRHSTVFFSSLLFLRRHSRSQKGSPPKQFRPHHSKVP